MPKDTFFNLDAHKQEKVVRAAIAEFQRNGYEKGNVGSIAKEAGVAKGSLYQYFENKQELFVYAVHFAMDFLLKKIDPALVQSSMNALDHFKTNVQQILGQIKTDIDLAEFLQDVFLGKYRAVNDESIDVLLRAGDEYALQIVLEGQKNGTIRKDIDAHTIALFVTGASMKIKQDMLRRAKEAGANIFESGLDIYEQQIIALIELLKNGMGLVKEHE